MDKAKARDLFETACQEVGEDVPLPRNWQRVGEKTFLALYCGVVFASGFKARIVDANFPAMKKVFRQFDPAALAEMAPDPTVAKLPIKNRKKTANFLTGAKQIRDEGWRPFKKRLTAEGLEMLTELPGIGHITKYHLAKNIGLADTAKPDIHLKRCAKECATSVATLVAFLCEEYHKKQYEVDLILFQYKSGYRISK